LQIRLSGSGELLLRRRGIGRLGVFVLFGRSVLLLAKVIIFKIIVFLVIVFLVIAFLERILFLPGEGLSGLRFLSFCALGPDPFRWVHIHDNDLRRVGLGGFCGFFGRGRFSRSLRRGGLFGRGRFLLQHAFRDDDHFNVLGPPG
jgi:hypothetical protein